jgi:hypothetical protein
MKMIHVMASTPTTIRHGSFFWAFCCLPSIISNSGKDGNGDAQQNQSEDHTKYAQSLIQFSGANAYQTATAQTANTAQNFF